MTEIISSGQYAKWAKEIASKIKVSEIVHDEGVASMTVKKSEKEAVGLKQVTAIKKIPDIEDIFKFYKIDSTQGGDVVRFLTSNTDLIPVLNEAKSEIIHVFGKVPVYLQLDRDPKEGFEELFGMIHVNLPVNEALAFLERFDREWFLSPGKDLLLRLNFDVEITE